MGRTREGRAADRGFSVTARECASAFFSFFFSVLGKGWGVGAWVRVSTVSVHWNVLTSQNFRADLSYF